MNCSRETIKVLEEIKTNTLPHEKRRICTAINTAIYALETKTPRKVCVEIAEIIDPSSDTPSRWKQSYCPRCYGQIFDEQRFCHSCGQTLDWSEENE